MIREHELAEKKRLKKEVLVGCTVEYPVLDTAELDTLDP